jgi:hypothetical protein
MFDDLPFKVIRINSRDEVIALCSHPMVGSAAYEIARQLYPKDRIQYSNGTQIIAESDRAADSKNPAAGLAAAGSDADTIISARR